MKIANIVYENELVNHIKVDYINYINERIEYDLLDKNLTTLYVGWNFMKSCNPNNDLIQNADILKKKIISNSLYFEFSFEESKASHVKGLENFVEAIPHYYFQPKYTYIDLDPVFFQIKDIEELFDILPKKIDAIYNFKNEMLYLIIDNKITGINLIMYNYFKFNIDEIIKKLNTRTSSVFNDLDGKIYDLYYKKFPNFSNIKRYIIVILTK